MANSSNDNTNDIGIYSYLVHPYDDYGHLKRLVGFITTRQVVFKIDNYLRHNEILSILYKEVFPKKGNNCPYIADKGLILILGCDDFISIDLPDCITEEQYECVEKIVDEINRFKKDYPNRFLYFKGKEIIKKAKETKRCTFKYLDDEVNRGTSIITTDMMQQSYNYISESQNNKPKIKTYHK